MAGSHQPATPGASGAQGHPAPAAGAAGTPPPGAAPAGGLPGESFWQELGWRPDERQGALLVELQAQLRSWNARVNLTRLVEGDDYWVAQVFDSLWPLVPLLQQEQGDGEPLELIDVGTGGGFPGLAVAIALPKARLTLVDSVGRKVEAVRAMVAALGLESRVRLRCERVERTGQAPECRGRFQLAMARAVAAAPVVAEYLVPLLAPGGEALLYRGQWSPQDRQDLERALAPLQARIGHSQQRDLPCGRGLRTALHVLPVAACPAVYPRAVGVPAKLPLGQTPAGASALRPQQDAGKARRSPG